MGVGGGPRRGPCWREARVRWKREGWGCVLVAGGVGNGRGGGKGGKVHACMCHRESGIGLGGEESCGICLIFTYLPDMNVFG